ncbi:hypothetical protein, partial [Microcoleus sp. N9_A1]|uniref:hypothetical protein n=1 Tax=Microcoleus sp. N9_A1 TaxID=3055380 RepID=UPI002FD70901
PPLPLSPSPTLPLSPSPTLPLSHSPPLPLSHSPCPPFSPFHSFSVREPVQTDKLRSPLTKAKLALRSREC